MLDPHLALVPVSSRVAVLRTESSGVEWSVVAAGIVATALFAAGLPIAAMGVILVSVISSLALARLAKHGSVLAPEMIRWGEARETYRAVLGAYWEIQGIVQRAPRTHVSLNHVIERCRSTVEACGRMARMLEPLQRYLERHDPAWSSLALERLRAHETASGDDTTRNVFAQARRAREQQIATCAEIHALRERILGRLALVHAAFETFAGLLVKLETLEDEQLATAGETLDEQLVTIEGELLSIEAVLGDELQAAN